MTMYGCVTLQSVVLRDVCVRAEDLRQSADPLAREQRLDLDEGAGALEQALQEPDAVLGEGDHGPAKRVERLPEQRVGCRRGLD